MITSSNDTPLPKHIVTSHSSVAERFAEIVRAARYLESERLQDERDVSAVKWFDYRFMSPIEATQVFYDAYRRLFKAAWHKHFDKEKAELKKGGPVGGLWSDGREFNSVWRARQVADGLGLPYEHFLREAIEAAMRRNVRQPPRPNQLYNILNMPHIHERWEERCRSLPLTSKLPQYRIESFQSLPAQVEHQTWMLRNLKARTAQPYAIAQACFEQRVLSLERAEAGFSSHQMEQVREAGTGMTPEPILALRPSDFWPSCFGIPQARSEASTVCAACHARADCGRVANKVREKLIATYGVLDPRDAEIRAQTRERVARHRAAARVQSLSAIHSIPANTAPS